MPLGKLLEGVRDPRAAIFFLHWYIHRMLLGNDGVQVPSEDWDTLVILDACRYDVFEECADLEGNLELRVSRGSHTNEFLSRNFEGSDFPDTVYLSATPQLDSAGVHRNFYAYEPLWKTHWDEDLETVPPAAAVDATLEAVERYPDKRIISHLIQPHYPFIGDTGRGIAHRSITGGDVEEDGSGEKSIWTRLADGEIPETTVYEAYVENLEIALAEVKRLLAELDGKTVITSDHGNSFGQWGVYGHPPRRFLPSLVNVPWLVVETGNRREISPGDISREHEHSGNVEERLRNLGYVE